MIESVIQRSVRYRLRPIKGVVFPKSSLPAAIFDGGLIGIRERVALVGGTCDIVSWPGDGTTIQVSIPLGEEAADV